MKVIVSWTLRNQILFLKSETKKEHNTTHEHWKDIHALSLCTLCVQTLSKVDIKPFRVSTHGEGKFKDPVKETINKTRIGPANNAEKSQDFYYSEYSYLKKSGQKEEMEEGSGKKNRYGSRGRKTMLKIRLSPDRFISVSVCFLHSWSTASAQTKFTVTQGSGLRKQRAQAQTG